MKQKIPPPWHSVVLEVARTRLLKTEPRVKTENWVVGQKRSWRISEAPVVFEYLTTTGRGRVRQANKGPKLEIECKCVCGGVDWYDCYSLGTMIRSCGCMTYQLILKTMGDKPWRRLCGNASPHWRGGIRNRVEYRVWSLMKDRCLNAKGAAFAGYGGRGIKVCERWLDFSAFFEDMGARPSSLHTIERINNDGNYEPGNCIWLPRSKQALNRRTTRWLVYKNERLPLAEMARKYHIGWCTLSQRLKMGWNIDDAIERPVRV